MGAESLPEDFNGYRWHDNPIYGMAFDIGDADCDTWHRRLLIDIDHFGEWRRVGDGFEWDFVPATLIFDEPEGLIVKLSLPMSCLFYPDIYTIERCPAETPQGRAQRFKWSILSNRLAAGAGDEGIFFEAEDMGMTPRGAPQPYQSARPLASAAARSSIFSYHDR